MIKGCRILDLNDIDEFVSMTDKAVEEPDMDRFIELLVGRDKILELINKKGSELSPLEAEWLSRKEEKVLERLREVRAGILKEMDELSAKRKAVKKYSSKFPFPSMPLFFNKIG